MKKVLSILCCATLCLNLCRPSCADVEVSTTSETQVQDSQSKNSESQPKAESKKHLPLKAVTLFCLLSVISASYLFLVAQESYSRGYKEGYKEGYHKGQAECPRRMPSPGGTPRYFHHNIPQNIYG